MFFYCSFSSPLNATTPTKNSHLSRWLYGNDLSVEYIPGRTVQSCDPSLCDWLHDLQLDLRAASSRTKTVSCVVANTETWYNVFLYSNRVHHFNYKHSFNSHIVFIYFSLREIQVLTCVEEDLPSRTKQFWVPVTMSGQVQ